MRYVSDDGDGAVGALCFNAIWAEFWDCELDEAGGACRDLGSYATRAEALEAIGRYRREVRIFGVPGDGYVTDMEGRLVEAALPG